MFHLDTDEHPTVGTVLLLGAISQIAESQRSSQELTDLLGGQASFVVVGGRERIVVKGEVVDDADD